MEKIAFIGYGHLGIQIDNLVRQNQKNNFKIVYFDDLAYEAGAEYSYPFEDYISQSFKNYKFCVSLGYKHLELKKTILRNLKNKNRKLLTFVHPTSYVDPTAIIEDGVIVYPFCNIDSNVLIKQGTLLNNSVTISHDSEIGSSCFIGPGVTISGFVRIGSCNFLGTGCLIANNITIGNNCKIGIGSVIIKDLENDSIGVGNPFSLKNNLEI